MSARISAYFSHSDLPEDREINEYFWKLFWEAGFTFTVDPHSGTLSIPHVERLVRRNACFAAVVTHRPGEAHYQASPHLVFEYGLAVRADRPRLAFVDWRAARHHYEEARHVVFDPAAISEDRERHVAAIRQLYDLGAANSRLDDRRRASVGLLLPGDGTYGTAVPAIRELLARAGYEAVVIDHDPPNPYQLLVEADRHDFVVIDVGAAGLPSWLYPVLYGHFVPMVRLLHHEPGRRPVGSLPRLALGHAVERVAGADELAIWWSGVDELVAKLEREMRALELPPKGELRTLEQGLGYFSGLGQSVNGDVFISNAGPENDFADELCRRLRASSVGFFHYVFENTIELGRPWRDGLRDRLEASQVFVPLITSAYWESDACREEYRIAEELWKQERLRIFPYFLEPGGRPLPLQGCPLHRLPSDRRVERIMIDIDSYLRQWSVVTGEGQAWWCEESKPLDAAAAAPAHH